MADYFCWFVRDKAPINTTVEILRLSSSNPRNNFLKTLAPPIDHLKNLRVIDLIYNRNLTRLPESIGNLKFLSKLDLMGTSITNLPESLKNITTEIHINIDDTPMASNQEYGLQLRSWPSNFHFDTLPPLPLLPPSPPTPLETIRSQINLDARPNDYIGLNEYSVNEFLEQGYKIFIKGNVYYAVKPEDELFAQINDNRNEYYICNRLANGGFERTNVKPLFSINIITGFQGFVSKEQLVMALNSQDNYFEITEKGDNIAVIKGHPDGGVFSTCKEANAKIYEIQVVEPIISSSSSNQNNTNNKYSFLQNLNKRHSDIFKGGRKRRSVKRKTRRVKRTRRR
jgi:hypothetical protein